MEHERTQGPIREAKTGMMVGRVVGRRRGEDGRVTGERRRPDPRRRIQNS